VYCLLSLRVCIPDDISRLNMFPVVPVVVGVVVGVTLLVVTVVVVICYCRRRMIRINTEHLDGWSALTSFNCVIFRKCCEFIHQVFFL